MIVSSHAISRYRERVEPVDHETARQRIVDAVTRTKAIETGAPFVKLARGQRIVLNGERIITVLPSDHRPGSLDPRRTRDPNE